MLRFLTIALAAVILPTCQETPAELRKDTTPPTFVIQFDSNRPDSDGDGLVDFVITWRTNSDVDPSATSIRAINNGETGAVDYADHWRLDSTPAGLTVHEKVPFVLSGGAVALEVTLRDTADNTARDTLVFTLPHAQFLKTIPTGRPANFAMHAVDLAICSDGLGYMPAGLNMVVFDPDSLRLVADVPNPNAFNAYLNLACDKKDETIYVTNPFVTFRKTTRSWGPVVRGTFAANVLRLSASDDAIIYVGEGDGAVASFNRVTRERVGRVSPPSSRPEDPMFGMAILPADEKIYATRVFEGGIIVVNPRTRQIVSRIDVGFGSHGRADDLDLSPDSNRLYATVVDGAKRGVAVIDTKTDAIINFYATNFGVPANIGISPSGRRIFLTTFDQFEGVPSQNALLNAETGEVLATFERPRTGGRWDAQSIFHSNGKFIFVAKNMDVDVYLNRE